MPRYFFHIRDENGRIVQDKEGFELPEIKAANEFARRLAEAEPRKPQSIGPSRH
jgi:hypothetical protein